MYFSKNEEEKAIQKGDILDYFLSNVPYCLCDIGNVNKVVHGLIIFSCLSSVVDRIPVHGGNSSQAGSKIPTMSEYISII
jgi:hypothetical protein